MAIASPAQTLTTLVNFDGYNGYGPAASLIQATDGNLYGTTQSGFLGGTIFKMSLAGTLTTLYNFYSQPDGQWPTDALVQATDGNFYGTTTYGGANGLGTVFKLTPNGTLTTLHSFTGPDGYWPYAGLVQATDGNFYGTTPYGAANGWGTVYRITPAGALTTLHSFSGSDGERPSAGLIQATDGNLYGTTPDGGANGGGTVFKITLSGTLTTLYNFCSQANCTDGAGSSAALVQGSDGNFYGTAGGGTYGDGIVFRITPSGTLTTLHSFAFSDGADPVAALVQATDGNFYGTTAEGGASDYGTVFRITPSGTLTTLYNFCSQPNCTDGANAIAGLLQANDGNFYGTTLWGGNNDPLPCHVGCGTVFKFQVPYYTLYTLTVTTNGDGVVTSTDGFINCPGTCSHSYLAQTQVTLNATPASDWAFTGWGGACSGTGSCQVTMTQTTNVSATFYQVAATLTVSVAGDGSVTSSDGYINCPGTCTHTYQPNTPVTLNEFPAQNWIFSGWTGACSGVGNCNIVMTANLAVTAVFVEPGYGIQFTPVTPCRLVDTRQTHDPIQGGTSQSYILPQLGGCNIPSSTAAYSLNVTVVPHTTLGYLTIWPTGEAQPVVSTMNSPDGRIKANAAIVPAGSSGAVSVYVTDTSDVILDIDGYFASPGSETYQFYPLTPCRIVDTRNGQDGGSLQAGVERDYPIPGNCRVPSNATAYSFNVTVVPTNGELDYLTVWPQGETMPVVSTLNDPTGTVVANAAIVPAGSNDATAFYAHDNPTNLIVDVNGYFAAAGSGGYSLYAVAPCRVLDTRQSGGSFSGEKTVNVVGSTCAPPSNAQAYIFNATVVPPGPMPYLTLWPDGEQQPAVSTLNAYDGFITSNMAIVPTTNGSIDAYAYALTQLILDISGYFAP
jgi:uncharacterized repeat protein (TIGR03803 family)